MKKLGKELRKIRESKNILLRQVASYLEIDTAIISKMERGERKLNRVQV
ncbi:MAG: helix-turn-helix domain-containing protein, partial [Bacteroidales bacterium]|nr:helix-turn-helix domain-containing protein [Bacteroidales bacterium]